MTIRAAMGREGLGSCLHAGGIGYGSGGLIVRMAIDRRRTNLDQGPVDDRRVLGCTSDTKKTTEKKHRRGEAENYRQCANRRQDAHVRLHLVPEVQESNNTPPKSAGALRYREPVGGINSDLAVFLARSAT